MVKLVTDWEIFKGCWYMSLLQDNVWDRFLRWCNRGVSESLASISEQSCPALLCVYINSLEQDHMCSTWLSSLSHTLTIKIFSRKQLLRYHSLIFHINKEILMLVVCHSFVHILNDPTVSLNDDHLICLSISQLLLPWFSITIQIGIYLISFSFHLIHFLHVIHCLLACVRLPFSFLFSWPIFWYPPEPFSHPWDALAWSTVQIIYWYIVPYDALKNGCQIF